jgi:hypothetical protein
MKIRFLIVVVFIFFALAPSVFAAGTAQTNSSSGQTVTLVNPLGNSTCSNNGTCLSSFLASILQFVVYIGSIIVILMLVYVGFLFVQARGKPEAIIKARTALLYTIIGALILLGAQAISMGIQSTVQALSNGAASSNTTTGTGVNTPSTNTFTNVPVSNNSATNSTIVGPVATAKAIPSVAAATTKAVPTTAVAQSKSSKAEKSTSAGGTCDPDPDGTTYALGSDGMCAPTSCAPSSSGVTYTLQGSTCVPNNGGCPPNDITNSSGSCVPGSASDACPADDDGTTYIETNDNCVPTNGGCPQNYITDPNNSNKCIPASASAACPPDDDDGQTYVETNDECVPTNGGCLAGQTADDSGNCVITSSTDNGGYGICECPDGTTCPDGATTASCNSTSNGYVAPGCTPDCSCAYAFCQGDGQTCDDGCGGTCTGTQVCDNSGD